MPVGKPLARPVTTSTADSSFRWLTSSLRDSRHPQREGQRLAHDPAVVGFEQGAEGDVPQGRGQLVIQDPHHLLGGDPIRDHAGHERARAGAHVDVELVDGAVYGQQVEGPQGTDLIDAARKAPAAEHQGSLRLPPATSSAPSRPRIRSGGLELDDLAHEGTHYGGPPQSAVPSGRSGYPADGAGKAVRDRAGGHWGARMAGARGRALHLALRLRHGLSNQMQRAGGASGAWVMDMDARRNRILFSWGVADTSRPGLEYEAIHDRCRARPLRGRPPAHDQAVRAAPERPARAHAQGRPGDRRGGRSRPRQHGVRPRQRPPADPDRQPGRDVRRAGIRRVTGAVRADDTVFDRQRGVPTSGVDGSGARPALRPLLRLGLGGRPLREEPRAGGGPQAEAPAAEPRGSCQRGNGPRQPAQKHAPAPPARQGPLAPAGRSDQRDEQALEQLLRRDAPQTPGGSTRGKGTTRRGARRAQRFARELGAVCGWRTARGYRVPTAPPREGRGVSWSAMNRHPGRRSFRHSLPWPGGRAPFLSA